MIKRSRPVYLADVLVDVEVETVVLVEGREKRVKHVVTLAGERRGSGRAVVFPQPSVQLDQAHRPVSVTLYVRSWLVNDGVVGTLPLRADDQRGARAAADAFVSAAQHGVVDNSAAQVDDWCAAYVRGAEHVEVIVGWSARVKHVEPLPEPVLVALPGHLEGTLDAGQAPEVDGVRGPFVPAVDPDSIVTQQDKNTRHGVDQAPALAHITEVAQ